MREIHHVTFRTEYKHVETHEDHYSDQTFVKTFDSNKISTFDMALDERACLNVRFNVNIKILQ